MPTTTTGGPSNAWEERQPDEEPVLAEPVAEGAPEAVAAEAEAAQDAEGEQPSAPGPQEPVATVQSEPGPEIPVAALPPGWTVEPQAAEAEPGTEPAAPPQAP